MKKNYFFTFLLTLFLATATFGQLVINEVDADQAGTDTSEFIELKWTANTSLNGYVVVLFNGNSDTSYAAYDLDSYSTDANGFFILATSSLATASDIDMGADNTVQNGADAVAIYQADASDFPNGTAVSDRGLIDAIVYGTNDPDDTGLLTAFGLSVQYDEGLNGNKDAESIQRHTDGTYQVLAPTFRAENSTSSAAALSITSPREDQVFNPETTSVNVSLSVDNFTVASGGTGDGYIVYSIDRGAPVDKFDTNDITFDSLTEGEHSVAIELVDNGGNSLSTPVTETVSFTIASYTQVADLSALRAGTEGEYYELTGEVVLTYAHSNRNQKYIQDRTAGILIDDSPGTITTNYNTYDGITGIRGLLGSFRGVLQFVPQVDPGAPSSTGNTIVPEVVTLADYEANSENYESELIEIQNVTFTDGGGTFAASTNYEITSGAATSTFRTNFRDADYIGQTIPTGSVNLTVLGLEFNGDPQVVAVNLTGIVLGVNRDDVKGFSAYPNPVINDLVTITSSSSDTKTVSIYNVLGKQVLNEKVSGLNNTVNVSKIQSGIYILKVTQGNNISTRKLVIQ